MIAFPAILKEGVVFIGDKGEKYPDIIKRNGCISLRGGTYGFVTNTGIFLSAEQAAIHAHQCGQIEKAQKYLLISDID
jgi:hypothetical protein